MHARGPANVEGRAILVREERWPGLSLPRDLRCHELAGGAGEEDVRNRMQHNLASLFDAHWAGLRARAGTTVSSNAALEHHQRLALTGSPAADANTAAGA